MQSFLRCCGSVRFAQEMARVAPFSSLDLAVEAAREIWWNKVDISGWLEAFAAHPRIGDVETLRSKYANERICSEEQAAALNSANEHLLQELVEWNRQYEAKFGFVFLICAQDKSGSDILAALKERYCNRPIDELNNAASEQEKITELRLATLMSPDSNPDSHEASRGQLPSNLPMTSSTSNDNEEIFATPKPSSAPVSSLRPPITTHVLDVALGRPGSGIDVALHWWSDTSHAGTLESDTVDHGCWAPVGRSVTNKDGRSGPLMPASNHLQPGKYRLTFNTGDYMLRVHGGDKHEVFYPFVMVVFEVKPPQTSEHFHIPLLLAPYSYSTYRGS
ncbi:hypothetical protein KC19_6G170700 [Ceratodon purpureus]|uniref:Hydroxyisourate hydrolase n=1 Tax=Ceratodon purpureus TaxID=3225 RepID=A0A8T0HGS0_CERPU|nr:hypothetical protein KC19_6G170700 [Ceratodon purpureus]